MDQATLKSWLIYHPETGVFTWAQSRVHGKVKVGRQAGCRRPDGYIVIRVLKKLYAASRLAFLYMTGEMPEFVDHIDRDRSNDRWSNLRVATGSQNQWNRSRPRHNTSGFKGVSWDAQRQKWFVSIHQFGKQRNLGRFVTLEEAAAAYALAAKEMHGSFARTT